MDLQKYFQEHFRKNDSITVYTPDGTPVVFCKQHTLALNYNHVGYSFQDYDRFIEFSDKVGLSLKPIISDETKI